MEQCREKGYSGSGYNYGVVNGNNSKQNLLGEKPDDKLPWTEPIEITFDKNERTVKFVSKTFDYYQNGLP